MTKLIIPISLINRFKISSFPKIPFLINFGLTQKRNKSCTRNVEAIFNQIGEKHENQTET